MGLGNLREIGSGNIGATNVLRTGNKKAAALTLLLDAGKGAVVVLLARYSQARMPRRWQGLGDSGPLLPVWLSFKGGKGVATFFGLMLALAWPCRAGVLCDLARCCSHKPLFVARRVDGGGWAPHCRAFITDGLFALASFWPF